MSKRSCRRALDADHGPPDGWRGSLFGPLGPPGPFFAFLENSFFQAKIGRRLCLKKLDFCIPWRGPKSENVTKHTMKLMISLWRLGPKKGPVSEHLGPRGPPTRALFGPWTVPIPIPFGIVFSFAAVILPGPPFSIQAAPRDPRFS